MGEFVSSLKKNLGEHFAIKQFEGLVLHSVYFAIWFLILKELKKKATS